MTDAKGSTRPSPFVFTTGGDTPVSGFSRAKVRIETKVATARKAAGHKPMDGWGVHDLRRTAATEMGRLGVAEFTIAKVLNHASRGITGQVYNRYEYLDEKRAALDLWAGCLAGWVGPKVVNNTASQS
jgi:integrase